MSPDRPAAVVVLAAGEGTRMKSSIPKVLHAVGGRTLVAPRGRRRRGPRARPPGRRRRPRPRRGQRPPGRGRPEGAPPSVQERAARHRPRRRRSRSTALPAPRRHRRRHLRRRAAADRRDAAGPARRRTPTSGNAVTVLTARPRRPHRLRPDRCAATTARSCGIVEQKDATDDAAGGPRDQLRRLRLRRRRPCATASPGSTPTTPRASSTSPTCVAHRARRRRLASAPLAVDDTWQVEGVNDRVQLAGPAPRAQPPHRRAPGCAPVSTVVDPAHHLDRRRRHARARRRSSSPTPCCAARTTSRPAPTVGPELPARRHRRSARAPRSRNATSYGAVIGPEATVGPYTYLRPGTRLGRGAKAGGFVEMKAAERRRRRQGAAPVLRRRRDDRRGRQHRRRHDLRQLRRRHQAATPRSARTPSSAATRCSSRR